MPSHRERHHPETSGRSPREGPAAPVEGHAVQPELVRESSTLEHLASTLKTWAPFDSATSGAGNAHVEAASSATGEPRRDKGPVSDEWGALGGENAHEGREARRQGELDDAGERIAWGKWDELPGEEGQGTRRVLLLGYKNGGVAVWDCSSLDTWSEILNLPTLDLALDAKLSRKHPDGLGTTTSGVVLPAPARSAATPDAFAADRPLLAFSVPASRSSSSSSSASSSSVILYSLRTHRIVHTVSPPGHAHRLLSNRRFLVVSTTSPSALHILHAHDLSPAPYSPLTDVARSPLDGTPVFDLGAGGRLLAYATTRPLLSSSRLDRSPARPGSGLLAHRGLFDAPELHQFDLGAANDLAAEAAQAGGEVARRAAEGVVSGVKAIGEKGRSYWMGRRASQEVEQAGGAGGGGGGGAGTFSKSAPQPSLAGFGRRTSLSAMTKLTPAAAAEENSAVGTVAIVDLLSPIPASTSSKSKSRARSVSSTSSPSSAALAPSPVKLVAHFRPYAQPVALVSLSPAGTSILTAPAAGHAFDVFELKPSVGVGRSATSSVPSSSSSASAFLPSVAGGAGDGPGKVWHRYRLHRGYTSAHAASASWSPDGRFLALTTAKSGTAHVYALNAGSSGGQVKVETLFGARVGNARELAPLSTAVGAVARVRAPSTVAGGAAPLARSTSEASAAELPTSSAQAMSSTSFASAVFLPKVDSLSSGFRPPPSSASMGATSPAMMSPKQRFNPLPPSSASPSSAAGETTFQDLLVFHPPPPSRLPPPASSSPSASSSAAEKHLPPPPTATLHRLSLLPLDAPTSLSSAAEGTFAAAKQGDVARAASNAASGLSQLMKRGLASPPVAFSSSAGAPGGGGGGREGKREWAVRGEVLAGWRLGRERGWGEVREVVGEGAEGEDEEARRGVMGLGTEKKGVRYSAFAEIETFSRSPLVLPRSIYQSQQFDFFALPPQHAQSTKRGIFTLPLRKLDVRAEVVIRQGDDALSSDYGPASASTSSSPLGRQLSPRGLGLGSYASSTASFEPASFDQPIKTAMHTLLDSPSLVPGSPSLPAPSFPNGGAGKHGSWRDTVVRQVAPAAMEGINKARQSLGRVRMPNVHVNVGAALPSGMIPLPLGRGKAAPQSAAAGGAGVAYSSSISFEDDDAVFAELDAASVGTGATSEVDEFGGAAGAKKGDEGAEEEDWGWDDRIGEVDVPAQAAPSSSSEVATPSSGALETPFDEDFDDLDFGVSAASKPLSLAHPSPFALDPVDDGSNKSSPSPAIPIPSGLAGAKHLVPPVSSVAVSSLSSTSTSSGYGYAIPSRASGSASSDFDPLPLVPPTLHHPNLGSTGVTSPLQLLDDVDLPRPGSLSSTSAASSFGGALAARLAAPTNGTHGHVTANTIARSASPASLSGGSSSGSGGKKKKKR
ncbi:hypothetical protein JCM8097_002562 [Rhodosporidiobolus ruineniae]